MKHGATQILSTVGLTCPLPLLRAQQALYHLQPGDILHIIATDPVSVRDFRSWGQQPEQKLLSMQRYNNEYHYLIIKNYNKNS